MVKQFYLVLILLPLWLFTFCLATHNACSMQTAPPPFPAYAIQSQAGHNAAINAITIHPSGKFIISAAQDECIKIWNYDTGVLIRTIYARSRVDSLALSKTGQYIFSGGHGSGSIKVWDFTSGTLVKELHSQSTSIHTLLINPKSGLLAAATGSGVIEIWDVHSGQIVQAMNARQTASTGFHVYPIAIDPKGEILACNGDTEDDQGSILLWDLASGKLLHTIYGHRRDVTQLAFDQSGDFIVSASSDMDINIWDVKTATLHKSLTGHTVQSTYDNISALAVDPKGRIISANQRGEVLIWDIGSGKLLETIHASGNAIRAVALHPNKDTFVVESYDNTLVIASRHTGKYIQRLLGSSSSPKAVAIDPTDRFFVSGHRDGSVKVWDMATLAMHHNLQGHKAMVTDVAISPDGKWIISASLDKTIRVWNAASGEQQHMLTGHKKWIANLAVTTSYIISRASDGEIRIWDLATGKLRQSLPSLDKGGLGSLVVDPSGTKLFSVGALKTIFVWNLQDGRLLHSIKTTHSEPITALAMDPQGRYLLSSSFDWSLQFWDTETYSHVHTINWDDVGLSLSLTADGKQVVAGSLGGSVRVWDIYSEQVVNSLAPQPPISTEKYIAALYSHYQPTGVGSVAVSRDGNKILSTCFDGTLKLWNRKNNQHVSLISSGERWAAYSDDGLFTASHHGGDLLSMTKGLITHKIERFSLTNNRPDLLLKRLGLGSPDLRAHFFQYHQKRLKEAGLTGYTPSPKAQLPTTAIVDIKQNGQHITLTFQLNCKGHELRSYNIYINDMPLYPSFGREIAGQQQQLTLSNTVELTPGKNKIEISCINAAGGQSRRTQSSAEFRGYKRKGDLFFVGFGLTAQYGGKDVQALEKLFVNMQDKFHHVYTHTYINEEVTPENLDNVREILANTNPNDTVVLFVAGHGLHDPRHNGTYNVLTPKGDSPAVSFENITGILSAAPSRKKIFIIDTGGAGGSQLNTAARNRGIRARASRGSSDHGNTPPWLLAKDRFIYNHLLRSSGAIVLTSCRDQELSYESDIFKCGIFTQAIVEGLSTGQADDDGNSIISIAELGEYIRDRVPAMSGNLQHPPLSRKSLPHEFGFPLTKESKNEPKNVTFGRVYILAAGITKTKVTGSKEAAGTATGRTIGVSNKDIQLHKETNIIPAERNMEFGLIFTVQGSPKGGKESLTVKVHHPQYHQPGAEKPRQLETWQAQVTLGSSNFVGWTFEHDWEIVPGPWRFELYHGDKKVGEHIFEVVLPKPVEPELNNQEPIPPVIDAQERFAI